MCICIYLKYFVVEQNSTCNKMRGGMHVSYPMHSFLLMKHNRILIRTVRMNSNNVHSQDTEHADIYKYCHCIFPHASEGR